ncbi:hypothetical protein ELH26_01400 [Rhizobium leguminosarum]|uniref:hypothetical protein n=1 Tax=Rhizobium leguminosarum TaxID=384 RepID=UPI00103027BE|nr:hypothetical protein [Rhizobium leguminosarum]NKL63118.1 hypothetical protein [Rhizobium leguminosarum bv. viciae]TBC92774.1 hypothetical protein ELH26_01400 [Rhizobium leguminosarum]
MSAAKEEEQALQQVISERSLELISTKDLHQFSEAALRKLSEIFRRAPVAGLYENRLLMLALARGGALHYENGETGLKDIDIWAFFSEGPPKPFPPRARWIADFGPSKFGRHPDDISSTGRRMDIIGRSITTQPGEQPEKSVRRWLNGWSRSAAALRQKPMFAIFPKGISGLRI